MTTNPKIIPSLSYRLYPLNKFVYIMWPKISSKWTGGKTTPFFLFLLSSRLINPFSKHNEAVKMRPLLDTIEMFSF